MNQPWGEFEKEASTSLEALVRHMITVSGYSGAQISRSMNRSSNFVWSTLQNMQKGSKLRVNLFAEIANICGYTITITGHGEEYLLGFDTDGNLLVLSSEKASNELMDALVGHMSDDQAVKTLEITDNFCNGYDLDRLSRANLAGFVSNPEENSYLFYDTDGKPVARCYYDELTGEPTTTFYEQ